MSWFCRRGLAAFFHVLCLCLGPWWLLGCSHGEEAGTPDAKTDGGEQQPRTLDGGDAGHAPDAGDLADAGDAGDGQAPPACPGVELKADGVLDLDIKTVRLTGTIKLGGKELPASWGSISLSDRVTYAHHTIKLASPFDEVVPAGIYDIQFNPGSGDGPAAFPSGFVSLMRGVRLLQGGHVDLDIPVASVRIDGSLTLNGQPAPPGSDQLRLVFSGPGEQRVVRPSANGATFTTTLLPGTYTIELRNYVPSSCSDPSWPYPCATATLKKDVVLTESGRLNIDIPTVHIKGNVTLNGQPLPDTSESRGYVILGGYLIALGSKAPKALEFNLVPGTYSAEYYADYWRCDGSRPMVMPCISAPLAENLDITKDRSLDIDIRTGNLTVRTTLNGATLPDSPWERGDITVRNEKGSGSRSLGSTGSGSFTIPLIEGDYRFEYTNEPIDSPFPSVGGLLRSNVRVAGNTNLDLDIRSVRVTGNATVDGQPIPELGRYRGELQWSRIEGASSPPRHDIRMPDTGPVSFAFNVLAGTYSAGLFANTSLCNDATWAPLPCMHGLIAPNVLVDKDTRMDLDVSKSTIRVLVNTTLNGQPTHEGQQGTLYFSTLDDAGHDSNVGFLDWTPARPTSYHARIFPGRYKVSYMPTTCPTGQSCSHGYIAGCR